MLYDKDQTIVLSENELEQRFLSNLGRCGKARSWRRWGSTATPFTEGNSDWSDFVVAPSTPGKPSRCMPDRPLMSLRNRKPPGVEGVGEVEAELEAVSRTTLGNRFLGDFG